MLTNSKKILLNAKNNKKVIYQFNINNLEWTKIILEKCNELNQSVILGVSEGAVKYMGGYNVVASLVSSLIKDFKSIEDFIPIDCINKRNGGGGNTAKTDKYYIYIAIK